MDNATLCANIEDVRVHIDRIDRQIVSLLAERGSYVKQAAKFKRSTEDVKAPQRVEQVILKVTELARQLGGDPVITERVYRTMISDFIDAEMTEHEAIASCTS